MMGCTCIAEQLRPPAGTLTTLKSDPRIFRLEFFCVFRSAPSAFLGGCGIVRKFGEHLRRHGRFRPTTEHTASERLAQPGSAQPARIMPGYNVTIIGAHSISLYEVLRCAAIIVRG